ncbi:MAG: MerR family transcriptional regulator [Desulfovibrio sp.]|nr:MAG: MerR family transcriptional regulator [Desulfovibrio sp.]
MKKAMVKTGGVPVPTKRITFVEVVELTGVHPSRIGELVELGWLQPRKTSEQEYLFLHSDVYRIRKFERLSKDFGLSCMGGTIIVDLLDRIEFLEQKVKEMERLLGSK